MQLYERCSMKAFVLRLLHEEHQGLPPIKWSDDPRALAWIMSATGIPLTVASWRTRSGGAGRPMPSMAARFLTHPAWTGLRDLAQRWVTGCTSRSFPGMIDTGGRDGRAAAVTARRSALTP